MKVNQESKITARVRVTKTELNQLKRIAEIQTESVEAVIQAIIRIVLNNQIYK